MAASPAREESRSSYPVPSASPQRAPRAVMFLPETHAVPTESSRNTSGLCQVRMEEKLFQTFPGDRVTDSMVGEAAKLFNENYGIWGKLSHSPGKPVRLSARRLREQYLPDHATTSYVRVAVDGNLAGNAFACRWKHGGKNICWVTQLVVDRRFRERGLATALLRSICADTDDMYGIMSSHPAACMAAASSYGRGIEKAPLGLVEANAKAVLEASPIPYIKNARLCGSLFNPEDSTGLVCGVDTGFFVDHKEPLEVVEVVRQDLQWPLGDLPEGHEYLLILPGKKRRSRSSSSSQSKGDVMPTH
ncbi:conserved hypothetical protein [Histoplasma capsulatum var. duboisii H88]|uniref:N-acetyltransferase domain-containing protein n=1 Tax=Ajellomyces capsulatus (strain H88) TaxID=544711 RepID=F0UK52_AJEC8|nr:conserved hypothetical protein [Histoplasma capsulatum var. duboisii H88]QSS57318.1 hypothetical protein I7I53_05755 [Histoplasma capsulatum var. duboisii H88]